MQRQLAIQRLQEQEKERQMRLEQQKHTIQMRAQMPTFSLPYAQVDTEVSLYEVSLHDVHFRNHLLTRDGHLLSGLLQAASLEWPEFTSTCTAPSLSLSVFSFPPNTLIYPLNKASCCRLK